MSKILEEAAELEQNIEVTSAAATSADIGESAEPDALPEEAAAVLAYEEIPAPKQETAFNVKLVRKKERKVGVIMLAVLLVFAGVGAAFYGFRAFNVADGLGVKNITELPDDAKIPAFSPIDPADFAAISEDSFITVPDETGLELPSFGHGPQVKPEPQNYYTQTPNVSAAFTRAAQDESYVYFLQGPASGKYGLYNLMRASILTGEAESVSNANEGSNRIYSFTLHGLNIITCEYKASTDSFAFYRVPKSVEDAQLLFETDSPAYMNVYDNKIFMLFVDEQTLGVFDPATDTQPSYIVLDSLEETAHYFPQFSVVNGYLYYGIWRDAGDSDDTDDDAENEAVEEADEGNQVQMEYLRRSLYTGETVMLLSSRNGDAIRNPCWDGDGGAYYVQYDSETITFGLAAVKNEGSPQTLSSFAFNLEWPLTAFKDEFLVTALPSGALRKYDRDDFAVELEVTAENHPFAVTKDFFVSTEGLYRLFDFGFIPFE